MKVLKFQIKNYKSIVDSGECYLSELVTILAGKNESGKSSILEALFDFNQDRNINEKSIRIEDAKSIPEITCWLRITKEEIETTLINSQITFTGKIPRECEFEINKKYPKNYSMISDFLEEIPEDIDPKDVEAIKKQYALLAKESLATAFQSIGKPLPKFDETNIPNFKFNFLQWKNNATPHFSQISNSTQSHNLQKNIADLEVLVTAIPDQVPEISAKQRFMSEILKCLPNFILFNSFTDVFPGTIPLNELDKNTWIKDLAEISNLDISIIQGNNDRQKITHREQINTEINEDFKQFWTQDFSNLVIEYDSQKVNFWIRENGKYYEPEIRSQGRKWHLAFYLKVSARAKEKHNNIILIDEPGLYLHANAQRDILKNLEACSKQAPIIFSTHSPYLIEEQKLERIRLIQKNKNGETIIENKIHRAADSETLTPILTAIGLELNRSIVSVDKLNNVIVEGISDYYYLNAMKVILNKPQINFIHGGSSGNMPKIGMILQGWGCSVRYLYDDDQAYTDAQKNIKRNWQAITKDLISKIPVDGAIEDMFDQQDFAEHILEIPQKDLTQKNSVFVKKWDKVLLSKKFREKVSANQKIKFQKETLDNFKKLFKQLEDLLKIEDI